MDDSIHSSPHADENSESYDADSEMTSQSSRTDTASPGSEASLDNERTSQDSLTETASAESDSPDINIGVFDTTNTYTPPEFPEIVICDVCYKKFSDRDQLFAHSHNHSPPIIYNCDECGKIFRTECKLEYHKTFFHTPRLYSSEKEN